MSENYLILVTFIGCILIALIIIELFVILFVSIKEHKQHKRIMANVIRHDKFSRMK